MSFFPDSFDELGSAAAYPTESTHHFDHDEGFTPPPVYSSFDDPESVGESVDDSVIFNNADRGVFVSNSTAPIYGFESNGGSAAANDVFVDSDGPSLPPPFEMQEEGIALREWRRQNAILLEQKENREKEILSQIIEEAIQYKTAFHEKRKVMSENNKTNNREREKLFLTNQETFHKEVDKSYWKAIAELVPNEVPTLERKRGKKDQEKKPSILVVQGPKPGKPTDLARMRQILGKLKHATPAHLKLTPPSAEPSKPTANVSTTPGAILAA